MDHNYLIIRAVSFIVCGGCTVFCGLLANHGAANGSVRDAWSRLSMTFGAMTCGIGIALLVVALDWMERGGLEP
jgi:hypothetical protein